MLSPALVFNCHYNGLSIIQELGRHGVPVYALDTSRSVGTVSRFAQYKRCPDPLCNEDAFIRFLIDLGSGFQEKPVLFPTNDHWAAAIARHKQELERWYLPCVADGPVVDLLISKDKFYRWAMERDYPVPHLYSADDVIQSILHKTDTSSFFPLIAKPIARRSSNLCAKNPDICAFLDSHRMTIISDASEFTQFSTKYEKYLDYFLFQEYIPGMADQMYTVGIYANKEHKVLGLFTGRKVRGFPPDIGDCIVGQNEQMPPEITECVKQMVKDLKYTGIAEFEFKKNPATGEFRLIEINPRSWSWIGITPAFGVSLPWIAYADLTGIGSTHYTQSTMKDGEVRYLKVLQDIQNCFFLYKKAGYPEYQKGISEWINELKGKKRIICAEFSLDDPAVSLYSLYTYGRSAVLSFLRSKGRIE